jgi:hypothetical protein
MAKQVTNLSGIVFPALKAAKDYVSDVLDVYMRYCAATAYSAVAAVDVTTEWDNKPRPTGTYAQTKAFAVVTASGSTSIFSMDKALEAIAI